MNIPGNNSIRVQVVRNWNSVLNRRVKYVQISKLVVGLTNLKHFLCI